MDDRKAIALVIAIVYVVGYLYGTLSCLDTNQSTSWLLDHQAPDLARPDMTWQIGQDERGNLVIRNKERPNATVIFENIIMADRGIGTRQRPFDGYNEGR